MASLIWEARIGSSGTYQAMKSPSSYKIDWEDLDKNSYRSTINGNLFRHPLSKHWYKIAFSWNYLTASEVKTIVEKVNQDNLYIRCQSPAFGTNNQVVLQGYVSRISTEMLEVQIGYTLSFNFVESRR